MKEETITINESYDFERPVGYKAGGHISVEDEILELCKEHRIYVSKIIRYDGYKVFGKKLSKKLFAKFNNT